MKKLKAKSKKKDSGEIQFHYLLLIYIFFASVAFLSAFLARDLILQIIEKNIHTENELYAKLIAFAVVVILIVLAVYFLSSVAPAPIAKIYPFLKK